MRELNLSLTTISRLSHDHGSGIQVSNIDVQLAAS